MPKVIKNELLLIAAATLVVIFAEALALRFLSSVEWAGAYSYFSQGLSIKGWIRDLILPLGIWGSVGGILALWLTWKVAEPRDLTGWFCYKVAFSTTAVAVVYTFFTSPASTTAVELKSVGFMVALLLVCNVTYAWAAIRIHRAFSVQELLRKPQFLLRLLEGKAPEKQEGDSLSIEPASAEARDTLISLLKVHGLETFHCPQCGRGFDPEKQIPAECPCGNEEYTAIPNGPTECPQCQRYNDKEAEYCFFCGSSLEEQSSHVGV